MDAPGASHDVYRDSPRQGPASRRAFPGGFVSALTLIALLGALLGLGDVAFARTPQTIILRLPLEASVGDFGEVRADTAPGTSVLSSSTPSTCTLSGPTVAPARPAVHVTKATVHFMAPGQCTIVASAGQLDLEDEASGVRKVTEYAAAETSKTVIVFARGRRPESRRIPAAVRRRLLEDASRAAFSYLEGGHPYDVRAVLTAEGPATRLLEESEVGDPLSPSVYLSQPLLTAATPVYLIAMRGRFCVKIGSAAATASSTSRCQGHPVKEYPAFELTVVSMTGEIRGGIGEGYATGELFRDYSRRYPDLRALGIPVRLGSANGP